MCGLHFGFVSVFYQSNLFGEHIPENSRQEVGRGCDLLGERFAVIVIMSRKKILIVTGVAVLVVATTLLVVRACETVVRYHVQLHYNWFEYEAYTDEGVNTTVPMEIMLTDFRADTTTNDGTFLAQVLVQPRGNRTPEGIVRLSFAPYQVHTYGGHRLYVERYDYNRETGQLIIIMTVEQRRYQTWGK